MKRLRIILLVTIISLGIAALSFGALDLKFTTQIDVSSAAPHTGDKVTFTVTFQAFGGKAKNFKVVGGIDGVQEWEQSFVKVLANATETVSFEWTATAGDHVAFFTLDPANEKSETDETNNHIEKSFAVSSGTNLKWDESTFTLTPNPATACEDVSASMNFIVEDEPVNNLKVKIGIEDGQSQTMSIASKQQGNYKSHTFTWKAFGPARKLTFTLDPNQTTSDQDFSDNVVVKMITPTNTGSDIAWMPEDFTMTPANPVYGDEILFKIKFRVFCWPETNLKIKTMVNGNVIKEQVYPHDPVQGSRYWAATWKAMATGNQTLTMILDPNHTSGDKNFADNTFTHNFTIPGNAPGAKPNLRFTKVEILPKKIGYNPGEQVTISYTVINDGTLLSPSIPVKLYQGSSSVVNWGGIGFLSPGETKTITQQFMSQCKIFHLKIDPANVIPELNESDNNWKKDMCKKYELKENNMKLKKIKPSRLGNN